MSSGISTFGRASALRTDHSRRQLIDRIEQWTIIAAVALSPVNFLRFDFAYITASDVCTTCALVLLLFRKKISLGFFGSASLAWLISLAIFNAGLLLGSIFNGEISRGLVGFAQYAFAFAAVPMLLATRSQRELLALLVVLLTSITAIMIHGIYIFHFDPDNDNFISGSGRLISLIERENEVATLCAIAIALSIWLRLARAISIGFFLISLGCLFYGLLLTGSNTGFLLTGAAVTLLVMLSGSFYLIVTFLVASLGIGFFIFVWGEYFLPEIFRERVLGALVSADLGQAGTFSDRVMLIREAIELADRQFLIGLGTDQYRAVSAHDAPVHNAYLLVLTEGGVLSLLGLLLLLLIGFFIGWRAFLVPRIKWAGTLALVVVASYALALNGFAHFYGRFWAVPLCLVLVFCSKLTATTGGSRLGTLERM